MSHRLIKGPEKPGDIPTYEVKCRHCQIFMHIQMKHPDLTRQLPFLGWGKRNGMHTCPRCMEAPLDKIRPPIVRGRQKRIVNTESAISNAQSVNLQQGSRTAR